MITKIESGVRIEKADLRSALGIEKMEAPIISVVGAGGKTSVVTCLAGEYEKEKKTAIVTTTTHMWQPKSGHFLTAPDMELFAEMIQKKCPLWLGIPSPDGKMGPFPMAFLEAVRILGIPMIIEADGAAGYSLKVPDEHEPAVWGKSTVLIGVAGLDSIGHRIGRVCHRPEKTAALLGKTTEDIVTCKDIAAIGLSSQGMQKQRDPYMKFCMILNKADNEERLSCGEEIARMLAGKGVHRVVLTKELSGQHPETSDRKLQIGKAAQHYEDTNKRSR